LVSVDNQHHEHDVLDEKSLEEMHSRFKVGMISELKKLALIKPDDSDAFANGMKSVLGYFKQLQSIKEIIQWIKQDFDGQMEQGVDILEFRRELEKRISILGNTAAKPDIS